MTEAARACCSPARPEGQAPPIHPAPPSRREAGPGQGASLEDERPRLVHLPGGEFGMGTDSAEGFA